VGDDGVMMGFPVGNITSVEPQPPGDPHNVLVEFEITRPFFPLHLDRRLVCEGERRRIFSNQRQLEVTRATNGYAMVVTQPVSIHDLNEAKKLAAGSARRLAARAGCAWMKIPTCFFMPTITWNLFWTKAMRNVAGDCEPLNPTPFTSYDNTVNRNRIVASWDGRESSLQNFHAQFDDNAYMHAVETPPISDQLQAMVSQVQAALPGILALTNKLSAVLDNAATQLPT
jgi:hypothetical protein